MQKNRFSPAVLLIALVFSTGCASGGGGGSSDIDPSQAIEVNIWNRSDRTIDVFARWQNAPRVRLGQLTGNRRRVFLTPVQGPRMAISWDILSGTPPAGTAPAGADFPQVADSPGDPQCAVDVTPGDRIEWTIATNGRSCSYIRLDPALQ